METFYKEVENIRKGQKTWLQTDLEFKQKKMFDLNKKYNVEKFSTVVRVGKVFAAEQKIREQKKRIFRLKSLEKKLSKKKLKPIKIIQKAIINVNNLHEQKYGAKPEEIEKNLPSSEAYKERFDFHRLEKISGKKARQDTTKKYKLRSPLELGEEVLILTGTLKKKRLSGKVLQE